ncbi:dihydroorotate dehydrogenase electron transfer subunit [Dubosiella muris]|uniref:Dihydroorotate dehydrogenase electron transfer subunit n=1 Tax=Dubosiella muris TaxID=3038133 RepID=A0AC61R4A4_9FIRM|nr:dihydroorotate dehydrogenase electron transfer subunit [Dubosiella muris]TGY64806.1 dihydroorotate dehydrogenase electron transfer subunit [Dubosiella muris]
MKQENAKILDNTKIANDVYKMTLETTLGQHSRPGQFVEIEVPGYFLRRPISISEITDNGLVIVYKVVGDGTKAMANMEAGEALDLFGPCGNGFPKAEGDSLLLIGGGVGVPPLLEVAKQNKDKALTVVLGFNTKDDVFYEAAFQQLGANVYVATMDGSYGVRGTVVDAIEQKHIENPFMMACGPLPMLKALDARYEHGYLSLEARMACGIGACMGCVVEMRDGSMKRVCKDGPVFEVRRVKL